MRGYGQRDPKIEYQREGYGLFEEMNLRIDAQAIDVVFKFSLPEPLPDRSPAALPGTGPGAQPLEASAQRTSGPPRTRRAAAANAGAKAGKVGRNSPCPCGSGKKFKKCCGAT